MPSFIALERGGPYSIIGCPPIRAIDRTRAVTTSTTTIKESASTNIEKQQKSGGLRTRIVPISADFHRHIAFGTPPVHCESLRQPLRISAITDTLATGSEGNPNRGDKECPGHVFTVSDAGQKISCGHRL
ncbi:hypothetical protein [Rubrivivax gelatinosus]|uniref:hypothetical protein n=1 Tax=Rubrivivax gelatinosus TaxID=28068 RepID=UPI0012FD9CE2|nr:hypothetical protein [Rubrivivax gelatinosus]MBG6081560.1 hypothetical protein [Rubrivivax gelatinosus]